jgi:rod shape-determining protein MreB
VKYAGDKLDQAIADYVKKQYNLAIGDQTAERVKMKIGTAVAVTEEEEVVIKGRDFVTGLPRSIRIKSNETAEAIDGVLNHVIRAIKEVLGQTPPELASDILDNGITLTGGSAQLKNLGELIYRRTGVKATVAKEPFYCVVRGAGIALDHLDTYKKMVSQK